MSINTICETITNCMFTTRVNQKKRKKNKNKNHNGKETKMNCTNKKYIHIVHVPVYENADNACYI